MRVLRAFKEGLMRFAIIAAGALAASAVVLSGNTARADATPTGIEVGLRSGYAIPMGDAQGGSPSVSLSDTISGVIPIWVDAGYRLNPNMMVGAFFQYGIAIINSKAEGGGCGQSGVSCSGSDMMFGAQFHYHLMPDQTIDPWAGVGVGYEIANASVSQNGTSLGSTSLSGFQFFNLQIGGDYKVMPNLGVGPFVMFSLGQYSNCSTTPAGGSSANCPNYQSGTHEWLTFGIRGAYDINL
jgi:outer membrane protein W